MVARSTSVASCSPSTAGAQERTDPAIPITAAHEAQSTDEIGLPVTQTRIEQGQ